MSMMEVVELYGVRSTYDVAREFGVTPVAVRKLCQRYGVGVIVGNVRMLTQDDVLELAKIRGVRAVGESGESPPAH